MNLIESKTISLQTNLNSYILQTLRLIPSFAFLWNSRTGKVPDKHEIRG